jgi:hypothetical protein
VNDRPNAAFQTSRAGDATTINDYKLAINVLKHGEGVGVPVIAGAEEGIDHYTRSQPRVASQ